MPAASILIKPASANCNIDCKYCFYKCLSSSREEYSKGFMSEETLEKLVIQAIDYAEGSLTFAFQGGEPVLAGLDFFRKAVALQQKYNKKRLIIENTIQTNGLLLDEEWAAFLHDHHFLVGLSLDGPRGIHDRYRTGVQGEPTFHKIMETVDLLTEYRVDFNILSVVTEWAAGKAPQIYRFYQKKGFPFLQFIPCMDEEGRQKADSAGGAGSGNGMRNACAVTAKSYGDFLCNLFDLWYEDYMSGRDVDIRMFSNLAGMAAGYPSEECGMSGRCTCYFVAEGDGSVYPCDFYCTDEWKLGTVEDSFAELFQSEKARRFVEASCHTTEKCAACPYVSLCRGGCRRWREAGAGGELGQNQLCKAYEIFFRHTWTRIQKLGGMILRKRM